jgi:uncharacterized protein YbbC (DUF1343 family)
MNFLRFFFFLFLVQSPFLVGVEVGADVFVTDSKYLKFSEKRIGLITNQSAVNTEMKTTLGLLQKKGYKITTLFAPEHGFYGDAYAYDHVEHEVLNGVPIYSLHGTHRRPTEKMLKEVDLLIYDIQDIGSRSYTYLSTLFYCMEEAARHKIPFVVLDRPNPMGGLSCDGPGIEEEYRSFLGYLNIPYCHGMTVGELACLFKEEHQLSLDLTVVPVKGWKRGMLIEESKLQWIPTSPQIPESDTPLFYPTTGIMGHCSLVSIGIGYTLPFKIVGAPWINPDLLAETFNAQKLPGVCFYPFQFRPFFGKHKLEICKGVRIFVTDAKIFRPVTTQFVMMGILKSLYPRQFNEGFQKVLQSKNKSDVFLKIVGKKEILRLFSEEKFITWKLREIIQKDCSEFEKKRAKYLIYGA